MENTTPSRSLADLKLQPLGTDLVTVVTALRGQGLGWRAVAKALHEQYDVELHWMTLHRWFRDDQASAA